MSLAILFASLHRRCLSTGARDVFEWKEAAEVIVFLFVGGADTNRLFLQASGSWGETDWSPPAV